MKHQAPRIVALMLSVLLAAAAPARAGTIHFADVMQAAAEGRRGPWADLRLRAIQQQGGRTAPGVVATTAQKSDAGTTASGTPDGSTAGNTAVSIISQDPAQQPQGTVQTIDLGDITGTVCDCGILPDIDVPGGFPLWPLLGLGGIPLLFINRDNPPPEDTPPGPTPNPTPPPAPIPEPATLLLFGSGLLALGAGARRRRGLRTLEVEARDQEVA
jgi:hypothetical protein